MTPAGPGYPPAGAPPGGPPVGYPPPHAAPGQFQPPPAGTYPGFRTPTPTTTEAILALVLAIVGVSTSCFPVSLVAIYFGLKARRQAREAGDPNNSNATLGLVGIILGAVFGALWGLSYLLHAGVFLVGIIAAIAAQSAGGP